MLAYIWEPKQMDVIHDHNSWGVVGTLSGMVSEKKYAVLMTAQSRDTPS
jgi:predicted metal-dependent enzyme (double-stranded beta helix superfamily)